MRDSSKGGARQFFPQMRVWSRTSRDWSGISHVFPSHARVIPVKRQELGQVYRFSRTRGCDPDPHTRNEFFNKVFPAHAGVILQNCLTLPLMLCFSRTRGGDPTSSIKNSVSFWFFPHTRGWSSDKPLEVLADSVFPAHAGVIPRKSDKLDLHHSFSRKREGDPAAISILVILTGFFSQTRVWSHAGYFKCCYCYVFPAHAGVILSLRN